MFDTRNDICCAAALLALAAMAVGAPAAAQEQPEAAQEIALGAETYRIHCATCHGKTGQGDGPMAGRLLFRPPDLTRLAGRNKGKFPFERIVRVVDGRDPIKGHGGPEMPIWGDVFLNAREGYSREAVRRKITQVVQYLETLQDKD